VLGLRNVADMELRAVEDGAPPWSGQQYIDRDAQVWTQLDLSLLVQDSRFLHVGI
jgi:twitching motility protein PilI